MAGNDRTIDDTGLVLEGGRYVLGQRLGKPSAEGRVYQAKYRELLDCAVKIVDEPGADSQAIIREVAILALAKHPNVVKITSWGLSRRQPEEAEAPPLPGMEEEEQSQIGPPFIVMELVPGDSLEEALESVKNPADLIDLACQLLEAVSYLHRRGILHLDIKPTNILVERKDRRVVLIDLGFSAVVDEDLFVRHFEISKENVHAMLPDEVYVDFHKEYASESRRQYRRKFVSRKSLKDRWFPGHDLYSLGMVFKRALSTATEHGLFTNYPRLRVGFNRVSDKLIEEQYGDAAEALKDMRRLRPGALAPLGVEELTLVPESGTSIIGADTTVPITARIKNITDHPLFQRLRSIPQLDFLSLLYPDTKHSRLSHSLMTYDLTRLATAHLLGDLNFRLSVEKSDLEAVLLFALLHDIGHFPLLHMFEDQRGQPTPGGDRILLDEDLFLPFLAGAEAEGYQWLAKVTEGTKPLEKLVDQEFGSQTLVALKSIAACANQRARPEKPIHRVLAGLVSSAIDLDKVSYLLLDSLMSGVSYGRGLDLDGLMTSLRTPVAGMRLPQNRKSTVWPTIAIEERGVAAAESVILARYWMLSRVYWHHTNRALMSAFKFVIADMMKREGFGFQQYLKDTFWMGEQQTLDYLADQYDAGVATGSVNPLHGLRAGRRVIYKRLLVAALAGSRNLFHAMGSPQALEAAEAAIREVAPSINLKRGEVLLDVPNRERDRLHLERVHIVRDVEGRTDVVGSLAEGKTLTMRGTLASRVSTEFLNTVKKARVFVSPRIYSALYDGGLLRKARSRTRAFLLDLRSG